MSDSTFSHIHDDGNFVTSTAVVMPSWVHEDAPAPWRVTQEHSLCPRTPVEEPSSPMDAVAMLYPDMRSSPPPLDLSWGVPSYHAPIDPGPVTAPPSREQYSLEAPPKGICPKVLFLEHSKRRRRTGETAASVACKKPRWTMGADAHAENLQTTTENSPVLHASSDRERVSFADSGAELQPHEDVRVTSLGRAHLKEMDYLDCGLEDQLSSEVASNDAVADPPPDPASLLELFACLQDVATLLSPASSSE